MRDAPTPTNISTNSEPRGDEGHAGLARDRAREQQSYRIGRALEQNTARGVFAPTFVNFSGTWGKSTTSTSSSLDASQPATSSNETPVSGSHLDFILVLEHAHGPSQPSHAAGAAHAPSTVQEDRGHLRTTAGRVNSRRRTPRPGAGPASAAGPRTARSASAARRGSPGPRSAGSRRGGGRRRRRRRRAPCPRHQR